VGSDGSKGTHGGRDAFLRHSVEVFRAVWPTGRFGKNRAVFQTLHEASALGVNRRQSAIPMSSYREKSTELILVATGAAKRSRSQRGVKTSLTNGPASLEEALRGRARSGWIARTNR
jgi:hypothetical protein